MPDLSLRVIAGLIGHALISPPAPSQEVPFVELEIDAERQRYPVRGVGFDEDGEHLVLHGSGYVGIFDIGSGERVLAMNRRPKDPVLHLMAVLPDVSAKFWVFVDRGRLFRSDSGKSAVGFRFTGRENRNSHAVRTLSRDGALAAQAVNASSGMIKWGGKPKPGGTRKLPIPEDTVWLYDTRTGRVRHDLKQAPKPGRGAGASERHGKPIFDVAFSPAGDLLAACERDGWLTVWDTRTGAVLAGIHTGRPYDGVRRETITWLAKGDRLVFCGGQAELRVVAARGGKTLARWRMPLGDGQFAVNAQGSLGVFARGRKTSKLVFFDLRTERTVCEVKVPGLPTDIEFSADGQQLALGLDGGVARVYDVSGLATTADHTVGAASEADALKDSLSDVAEQFQSIRTDFQDATGKVWSQRPKFTPLFEAVSLAMAASVDDPTPARIDAALEAFSELVNAVQEITRIGKIRRNRRLAKKLAGKLDTLRKRLRKVGGR